MNTKKRLWMISLMLVGAIVIAACGPAATAEPPAAAPVEEEPAAPAEEVPVEEVAEPAEDTRGTLRWVHYNQWGGQESLDPFSPTRMLPLIYLLYDRLVVLDANGVPAGDLATSWEPDETGQTWTFHLREGVKFHDGTPFTAQDVVYSFQHMLDPDLASPLASTLNLIDPEGISTPDDLTVVFNLTAPHADFPFLLTDYRARIIADGSVGTIEETGNGTGPFILEVMDLEGTTSVVANDNYWAGKPALARITVVGIGDSDARVQALLADQIDYDEEMSAEVIQLFEGNPDFVIQNNAAGYWQTMSMNVTVPPFDDPLVREAMKLVLDSEEALAIVLEGSGTIACHNPVFPGDQYYLKRDCEQNIEQAKALLAEAGYPDGLTVTLTVSDVDPLMVPLAVVYQAQAAEAGITVEINQIPSDAFWSEAWLIEPFVGSHWGERPADQVLNEVFRCGAAWGETYWCNDEFEQNLDDARTSLDFEDRKAIYQRAQELQSSEGGEIIPFFVNNIRIFSTRLQGVGASYQYSNMPYYLWSISE